MFKGDGLHTGSLDFGGVDLQHNEEHHLVMQKVQKLEDILQRFGDGLDTRATPLLADKVLALRKKLADTKAYWAAYDARMQSLSQPGAVVVSRFELSELPTNHLGPLDDGIAGWLDALEDSLIATTMCTDFPSAVNEKTLPKGSLDAAAQALLQAVKTHHDSFQLRQEFTPLPSKELRLQGAAAGRDGDAAFDRDSIAVGDVVLVRINPEDPGQDGRPYAIGIALHPQTKDHLPSHKKGQIPAVFSDSEVGVVVVQSSPPPISWLIVLHALFSLHSTVSNTSCTVITGRPVRLDRLAISNSEAVRYCWRLAVAEAQVRCPTEQHPALQHANCHRHHQHRLHHLRGSSTLPHALLSVKQQGGAEQIRTGGSVPDLRGVAGRAAVWIAAGGHHRVGSRAAGPPQGG